MCDVRCFCGYLFHKIKEVGMVMGGMQSGYATKAVESEIFKTLGK